MKANSKITLLSALIGVVLIFSFLMPNLVSADGGVFVDIYQHVYLPEQKAAIFWDGTSETLILSTKIKSNNLTNMAWVIPLPSKTKPEIEEGDINVFYELAEVFGKYRAPLPSYEPIIFVPSGLSFLGSIVAMIFYIKRKRREFLCLFILFLVLSPVLFMLAIMYAGSLTFSFMDSGVEPIEIKQVDIYDVATLKATNATALVEWLNENGYAVPESAIPVLQDYCDKEDFYFVANKINLEDRYNTTAERSQILSELQQGIATPLEMTFQPDEPFYPEKISGINDGSTHISVYVISPRPVADKSGILSVQDEQQLSYHFGAKYKNYHVTLLKYNGALKTLQADSIFLQEIPLWMQWWFWATITTVTSIVLSAGTVYFLKKRKPPTRKPPATTPPPFPTEDNFYLHNHHLFDFPRSLSNTNREICWRISLSDLGSKPALGNTHRLQTNVQVYSWRFHGLLSHDFAVFLIRHY